MNTLCPRVLTRLSVESAFVNRRPCCHLNYSSFDAFIERLCVLFEYQCKSRINAQEVSSDCFVRHFKRFTLVKFHQMSGTSFGLEVCRFLDAGQILKGHNSPHSHQALRCPRIQTLQLDLNSLAMGLRPSFSLGSRDQIRLYATCQAVEATS
jgi:hypothetical protein